MTPWLVDTGPLVAIIVLSDEHHAWTVEQLRRAPPQVLTCDAVISEALFLLKRSGHDCGCLFDLIDTGFLQSDFRLVDEYKSVQHVMQRYADLPTSFADACLVRMCELHPHAQIWTLDRDFHIYRQHKTKKIPLIIPE